MTVHRTAAARKRLRAMTKWGITLLVLVAGMSAQAVEVVFKPVAPGVYAFIGETEGRTYANEGLNANIGLLVTHAGAVLIDSGASFEGARQIAEAAQRAAGQPIKWVINTGGQDHRWLGNGYFKAQGAEIIAHSDALPDMQVRAREHSTALAAVLKEKFAGTEPAFPTRLLAGESNRLVLGDVVVEVLHRHGGHTPGDSVVWLPDQGVAYAGDIVYVDRVLGLHPVSNTKNWLASFAMLEALSPRLIVPGHGSVTDLARARAQTRDLLLALRAHMRKAVDDGVDLGAAVKSFNAEPFKGLQHADVWIPQLANQTYLEIEQE
jgi:glyoxylase-like metal-dependent hydrolase (beta-lactamase superfamily II)